MPTVGKLDFAENRVDSATGTLRLRAKFPNPDFILQPGLFGRIHVPGSLPYKGILIPDEAVAADQDRRIVYVVDESGQGLGQACYGSVHGCMVIASCAKA